MQLPVKSTLQGGRYEIVRFINSGGFGCTYEARHVMLGKNVAIKEFFVKDFCNRDETTSHVTVGTISKVGLVNKLRSKFIDEAKALSQLVHPGIVRVSDVFEENGTAYYVMDFIDGESLNDIVNREGAIPEERAVRYIRQVCDAMRYVHSNNRLHLDIKPANIMINKKDQAILIDFGASKQYDEEAGENTSTLVGKTPGYAPIEQMGNNVTKFLPATDIYAIGATLYKLLTGNTPLSSGLLATGEELDPLPESVSDNAREAVEKAMRIKKKERPQSIDEFLTILDSNKNGIDKNKDENHEDVDDDDDTLVVIENKNSDDHISKPKSSPIKVSQPPVISHSEGKKSKKTILIVALSVIITLAVVIVIGSLSDNKEEKTVKSDEPVEKVVPAVIKDSKLTVGKNSFTYSGEVNAEGMPQGKGTGIYEDGTYSGNYENGERHGKGDFRTADGQNHFEGTFVNDQYSEGKLTLADGSYFVGTFKDNNFDTGEWFLKDGKSDGKMKNGKYI